MASSSTNPPRLPIWWTTLAGNFYILFASVVLSIVALLTFWIPPRGRAVQVLARVWARGLLWCSGVTVTTRIEGSIPADRNFVVMANHQSLFDIPVLLATLPVPALFMAKRELFQIPLFGWAMRSGGFIPVDRRDQRRARESFREAVSQIQDGRSVLLFPEETRSVDGRLLPFKRGGFLLARKGRALVLPVGIQGTLAVQERTSYGIRGSDVVVNYGRPLPPDTPDLAERVRDEVERLADRDQAPAMHQSSRESGV